MRKKSVVQDDWSLMTEVAQDKFGSTCTIADVKLSSRRAAVKVTTHHLDNCTRILVLITVTTKTKLGHQNMVT